MNNNGFKYLQCLLNDRQKQGLKEQYEAEKKSCWDHPALVRTNITTTKIIYLT
jgi:hypothetical protein